MLLAQYQDTQLTRILPYANDKWTEKEIMESIPFTIASKISWDNSNQVNEILVKYKL